MYSLKFLIILFFSLKSPRTDLESKGFNDLFFKVEDKCYICAQSAQKFLSRIIIVNEIEIFQLREALYSESNEFNLKKIIVSNNNKPFLLFPVFSGKKRQKKRKNEFEKQDLALGYLIYSEYFIGNKFQFIPCDAISFMLMPFIFKFIITKYLDQNHTYVNLEEIFSILNIENYETLYVLEKMELILNRLIELYTISCLTKTYIFTIINATYNQILDKFKNVELQEQICIKQNKPIPLLHAFSPLKMNKDNFISYTNSNEKKITEAMRQVSDAYINVINRLSVILNCLFCSTNFDRKTYDLNYKNVYNSLKTNDKNISYPLKIDYINNNSFLSATSQGLSCPVEGITP